MRQAALVTGAARGIGRAIALTLSKEGFDIAVADVLKKEDADEGLQACEKNGARTLFIQSDISRPEGRKTIVESIRKGFGRLDVLVNNAGVAPKVRADILEATEESFDRLISINLKGPYFLTQLVANWMVEQKKNDPAFAGKIINIASNSSYTSSTSRGDYCISKAGVSMMTKLYADRLADSGVNVYEVRPGIIATDMTAGVKEKYDKLIAEGLMIQPRWGLPKDVGKAVAMLVRGDLSYSTSQVVLVDGGMTVQRL
jgi:3-oxoacyl-[acyl-carrier protein] reductase